jgi:hypothetical protein
MLQFRYRKFNVSLCHSHENGNLVPTFMIILDSRSTDCGNDKGRLSCLILSRSDLTLVKFSASIMFNIRSQGEWL